MSNDPIQTSKSLKSGMSPAIRGGEVKTSASSETQDGLIARSVADQARTTGIDPAMSASSPPAIDVSPADGQSHEPERPRENLRVLLVDDDGSVRRLVAMALHSAGFEVLEAADGNAAVQLCEQTETIHLVLADVLMPKLSGRQLASHVVLHHPEAKVLLMSGYPNVAGFLDGVVGRAEKTKTEYGFIQKPFGPAQLIQKIREMLAQ